MNNRVVVITVAVFFDALISASSLCAQDEKKLETQQPAASLQQQIDQLKEVQERILREMAEIRKSLQEKPGRVEAQARPAMSTPVPVNVHGEPFRGNSRARVAIMEYSDFECSFCAKYVREIYPRIHKDYVESGQIKYFFRDLPAPGETNAWLKARAARCAGEQGKFWEAHDRLFALQTESAGQDLGLHAQALGLNVEKFNACLASDRYSESIRMSIAAAKRAGIYGTPAFLIGTVSEDGDFFRTTKVLVGGESFEAIKSAVDELLAAPAKSSRTPP